MCPACADNCSGVLLNGLEELDQPLMAVNASGLVGAWHLRLAELERRSREVQVSERRPPLDT